MDETTVFELLIAGSGFVTVYVLSAALGFFVALKSPPNRRAAWTVGIAYAAVTAALVYAILAYGHPPGQQPFPVDPFIAPLVMAPGTILIFLLQRWGYRKMWIENPEDLRDGETLANDDWRIGLGLLLIAIVVLAGRAAFRIFLRS